MNPIKEIVRTLLKENGFLCRRVSWYRQVNDVIQIFNIQKSAWGELYYINLGIDTMKDTHSFPKGYRFPPEYKFPVRFRAEAIVDDRDMLNCLDYSRDYPDRSERVLTLTSFCLQFLDGLSSKKKILEYYSEKLPYFINLD